VSTDDEYTKRVMSKSYKEAMGVVAREDNSHVHEDIAFEDNTVPRFIHFCRASCGEVSNEQRWLCSRNLRNLFTR
ncbi:hypothetical protein PENTCL1PPCAC_6026, partial [Pristionchus entomophagus]